MTDYSAPPVGVSITVPLVGYVQNVKNGVVTLKLRDGGTFIAGEPEWEFATPDWLPPQFGDIIESSDDRGPRYLFIGGGQWVNQNTGSLGPLTEDELSRCRLLSRSTSRSA